MSQFEIIKEANKKLQENILKGFSDADDILEKGKIVPIGTEVTRKSGVVERKTANGWERVKKEKSPKTEEQHSDKTPKAQEQGSERQPAQQQQSTPRGDSHPYESVRNSMSHEQLSQKVTSIVRGDGSKKGKILEMYKLGLNNDEIVNYSGAKLSDVKWYTKEYQKSLASGAQQNTQSSQNTRTQNNATDSAENSSDDNQDNLLVDYEDLPEISTADRWNSYELFGKMMCLGAGKSMIAYGSGGVGKTYTLMGKNQIFDQFKMKAFDEELHDNLNDGGESIGDDGEPVRMAPGRYLDKNSYDYVKITGKVSAAEMFKTLAEHNGKVIIFDDCDSVLKDENSVNVLKGALDTTGDGTISWKVAGDITTDYANIEGAVRKEDKGKVKHVLPKRFKFKGQVMFISNLNHKEMPQALISRALNVDLTMNADETSERLQQIYPHMDFQDPEGNKIDVSMEDKKAAADFIHKYRHALDTSDLNARTLGKIAMIKKVADETGSQMDWQKAAVSMLKKKK